MTKIDKPAAYTKGAKRRKRKARISLAGGQSVAQNIGSGRRTDLDDQPPPIHAARARRCQIDTTSPLHESDMGRCIIVITSGDERADLANTWAALSACRRNYRARIIGQTGDPQGAAIGMIPDAMQTDQSLRVDLRTAEERDLAAQRAWSEWDGAIKRLPTPQHKWAIRGALDGFMGEAALWRDGKPTSYGQTAVDSLKMLTAQRK